jgi:type I restriction enzyme S subunit
MSFKLIATDGRVSVAIEDDTINKRIEQGWSPQADQRIADEEEWAVMKVGAVLRGRFRIEEHKALPPGLEPERRFELREGDLLLTRGNTPELVADACIVPRVRPRLLLSDLHYRVTIDESKLTKRFTCYWLLSRAGRDQIEADAHGTSNSMVKVSQYHIRSWFVAVPPVDEQDAICGLLDKQNHEFDTVISRIDRAISCLREFRAALITAAVTGQIDVRNHRPEAPCQ